MFIVAVIVLAGCRPAGLAPLPPEQDATNAEAGAAWSPSADPMSKSSFDGVNLEGSGHAGHGGHAGHAGHAGHGDPSGAPDPSGHEGHDVKESPGKAASAASAHTGHNAGADTPDKVSDR